MPLIICIAIGALLGPFISLKAIAPIAGGLFLFISSWEFNPRELFRETKLTLTLWAGAFFLPFASGAALPYIFPNLFLATENMTPEKMSLVLGIAMSVSAVPVIIKIMQEMGWAGTERAKRVLSTAILCDLAAWILFIPLLPKAGQAGWIASHITLLLFFLGLLIAMIWPIVTEPNSKLQFFNQWIVAPIFFITIGQKLDFTQGFNGWQAAIVFIVATISKVAGVWFAAKQAKLPKEESFAISLALNARGAMEIVMASFAVQAGLIDSTLFLSLVIMAISTSLLIKPVFQLRRSRDLST